jgi:hypothetical protein
LAYCFIYSFFFIDCFIYSCMLHRQLHIAYCFIKILMYCFINTFIYRYC